MDASARSAFQLYQRASEALSDSRVVCKRWMRPLSIVPARCYAFEIATPAFTTRRTLRTLRTIAIETSCDDTSVAVLERRQDSMKCTAQLLFHKTITSKSTEFRGVHPLRALESHQEHLASLVKEALPHLPNAQTGKRIQLRAKNTISIGGQEKVAPDFISVTRGPGMRSNLQIGLDLAKGLAVAWDLPLVGVHHMQAHALTPRLLSAMAAKVKPHDGKLVQNVQPQFPFLSLLISGGHTLLILTRSLTDQRILASTSDTAIGDCLDKVARAVLPKQWLLSSKSTMYGALMEQFAFPSGSEDYQYTPPTSLAEELTTKKSTWGWSITPPFSKSPNSENRSKLQFSFAGLTTQAERLSLAIQDPDANLDTAPEANESKAIRERRDIAREAMRIAFEQLAGRLILALDYFQKEDPQAASILKTVVVGGGVAANKYLRHVLAQNLARRGYADIQAIFPAPEYCTDNAAMVAWAGMEMFESGYTTSLSAWPINKWPLDSILNPPKT